MTPVTSRLRLALVALLCRPGLAAAQTPAPERIAGIIRSASDGHPLPRATVTLQDSESAAILATTTSGPDGSFRFAVMPPGRYQLLGSAHGFVTASFLEHEGFFSSVVTGQNLPTGALTLQLTPAASISGRVLDQAGESTMGQFGNLPATLRLFCVDPGSSTRAVHGCRQDYAAADGSFEFTGLAPGTYFLTASAQPWYAVHPGPAVDDPTQPFLTATNPALDIAYPLLFYPAATTEDRAQPIILKAGDVFLANFQMTPEHALSIVLPAGPTASATSFSPQVSRILFGEEDPVPPSISTVNGTTYLSGLAPGQYTLSDQRSSNGLPSQTRTVSLSDQSVTLNPADPFPSATVTLTAHTLDGTPLPRNLLLGLHSKRGTVFQPANVKGVAVFSSLPPGDYQVQMSVEHALLRLAVGGSAIPDRHLHLVPGDRSVAADLTVGPVVTLQGYAGQPSAAFSASATRTHTAAGQHPANPAVASMVLLIPADHSPDLALFRRDQTDLDGNFALRYVTPGNYLLLALDNGWSHPWTDLHWLAPYLLHAQPLHIPNTAQGTIHLPTPLAPQQVP